ncbi:hypothetical protein [Sutcliffiella halmapala]|uniref:hypothetical protein n=1 Tax=Sutcliffiella halmapala TaxID=79882 RepID=UPI001F3DA4A5|nr:hypothetical protein [Sutcliffiella halmapala]
MLGQRYYIYLFYINAVVSVTAFIPQLVYKNRYNGSLTSLALSTLAGTILLLVFQSQIRKFPRQNLSEILNRVLPSFFKKSFLALNFTLSIFSGILFLHSIMQIIGEFLTLNPNLIFYCILLLIVLSILSETNSLLFMLEMTVLFATPLILLILLRFFTDDLVLWDSINESLTYVMHSPKMNSVVAGLFVFTGFTNFLIYSEHIRPFSKRYLWLAWTIICVIFSFSYFIPIGYFGLNGVGIENYVWITTIDSMHVDYFFLERVVIVFILALIGITLMYLILIYHSSIKFLQMMTADFGGKTKWSGIGIVVISALITQFYVDEINLMKLFLYFFVFRIILDLLSIFLLFCASKKGS